MGNSNGGGVFVPQGGRAHMASPYGNIQQQVYSMGGFIDTNGNSYIPQRRVDGSIVYVPYYPAQAAQYQSAYGRPNYPAQAARHGQATRGMFFSGNHGSYSGGNGGYSGGISSIRNNRS
jgi:hypothetical protein